MSNSSSALAVPAWEAADPNSGYRRAQSAASASTSVLGDRQRLEVAAVRELVQRFEQLRRELKGILAAGPTEFGRFTASTLLAQVDALLADAQAEILNTANSTYNRAFALGQDAVDQPMQAARIAVTSAPALDRILVSHAFDVTGDLLTPAMQEFRGRMATHVRRAATTGANTFDQIRALGASIDDAGFDGAMFKAERIIRTELGRVFSGANFDRMMQLAATFPFLRKAWRASKDSRTRLGHREAGEKYPRGRGIPVASKFVLNVYDERPGKAAKLLGSALLRFPIDPQAEPAGKLAAGATIMCRCNSMIDFDLEELRNHSLGGAKPRPVVVPDVVVPRGDPPPAAPKERKPRAPRQPPTAEQVRKKLNKHADVAGAAYQKAREAQFEAEDLQVAAGRRFRAMVDSGQSGWGPLLDERNRLEKAAIELRKKADALRDKLLRDARRMLYVDKAQRRTISHAIDPKAEWGLGSTRNLVTGRLKLDNVAKAKKQLRDAIAEVEKMVGSGSFGRVSISNAPRKEGAWGARAYAQQNTNGIYLDRSAPIEVTVHELGHILEFNSYEIQQKVRAFYERRTAGEALEPLSKITGDEGYGPHEVARKDKFITPYMGKYYGVPGVTEIVSMGLEYFYRDPIGFAAKDPDFFDFIFNLLRGR